MTKDALPAAWILAGGLGTRLSAAVPDRPKALALVDGRPFLDILLDELAAAGFGRCLLLLGSRHQAILEFVRQRRDRGQRPGGDITIDTSVEPEPLGTGGALRHARAHAGDGEPFFVLNGDTTVQLRPEALLARHRDTGALVTIAAVEHADTRRFGRLDVTPDGFVRGFREKSSDASPGLINAGVYLVEPAVLSWIAEDRPVSLEQEVFPRLVAEGHRLAVVTQPGELHDIGTPDGLASFVAFTRRTAAAKNQD